jgi:argininosuccinate synthase
MRVALAYSGGLDTSVAIRWMRDRGYDVRAVAVDVGQPDDFDEIVRRGVRAGAAEVRVVRVADRFADEFLARAVAANGLYEAKYPMVSALARPLIAEEIVGVARDVGADAVAHGCTGKGNDQVRFEVAFGVLAPDLAVLAPIRDAGITREDALRMAAGVGIPVPAVASSYSVDENLWGRTVECGALEDPWATPPEDAFARTAPADRAPTEPTEIVVGFDAGRPASLDGTPASLRQIVLHLSEVGGRYGYGRVDMIENRRVGIKSREVYEVPAALALLLAHRALEDMTLDRDVAHAKPALEQRWSELVYDGMWFSPLRAAVDAFVERTQEHVRGEVRLRFGPASCAVVGRRSEAALYDEALATYGAGDGFDHRHAEGFVRLWGLPLRTWAARQGGERRDEAGASRAAPHRARP